MELILYIGRHKKTWTCDKKLDVITEKRVTWPQYTETLFNQRKNNDKNREPLPDSQAFLRGSLLDPYKFLLGQCTCTVEAGIIVFCYLCTEFEKKLKKWIF